MNLLLEKCGYLVKNWFIWFKPACTAQSANPSSKTWFKRPDEQYIHALNACSVFGATCKAWNCLEWPTIFIFFRSRGIYLNLLQLLPEIRDTV